MREFSFLIKLPGIIFSWGCRATHPQEHIGHPQVPEADTGDPAISEFYVGLLVGFFSSFILKVLPGNVLEESHHDDPEKGRVSHSKAMWEFF